jgi:two-component system, chemotaxis family, chemotaxis protein CheY
MAYNVLIVDDSTPMRTVIKKVVKASGFNSGRIYEASNGKEALGVLEKEWLDIVLTDYNMPEMDGLMLLEEMQKNETFRSIPVVMITTEGSKQRVDEFLKKGAKAYIKKPFSPEEIKHKLNSIMGETSDEVEQNSPDIGDEELDF